MAAMQTFQDQPTTFCDFGRDVSGVGDFDGDGVWASYGFNQDAARRGDIFFLFGNEGPGRSSGAGSSAASD